MVIPVTTMTCASLHAYSSDWKRCPKMGLNFSLCIQFSTDFTGIRTEHQGHSKPKKEGSVYMETVVS